MRVCLVVVSSRRTNIVTYWLLMSIWLFILCLKFWNWCNGGNCHLLWYLHIHTFVTRSMIMSRSLIWAPLVTWLGSCKCCSLCPMLNVLAFFKCNTCILRRIQIYILCFFLVLYKNRKFKYVYKQKTRKSNTYECVLCLGKC